jgi:hypothetical protein
MKNFIMFSLITTVVVLVVFGLIKAGQVYSDTRYSIEFTVESIDENEIVSGYTLENDGLFTTVTYIKCPKYLIVVEDSKAYLDRRHITPNNGHDLEVIHVDNLLPQDK